MSDTNVLATIDEMKENDLFHTGDKISAFLPEDPTNVSNFSTFPTMRIADSEVNWGKTVSFTINNPNADYVQSIFVEFTLPKIQLSKNVIMGYARGSIDENRMSVDDIKNQEELLGQIFPNYNIEMNRRNRADLVIRRTSFLNFIMPLEQNQPLDRTRITPEQFTALDEYVKERYFRPGNVYRARWIDNVGHYIMKNIKMIVDEIEYFSVDPFYMDVKRHFDMVGGTVSYDRMIGHVEQLYNSAISHLDKYKIVVPVKLPITRNKNHLPLSLIDKEVKIQVTFADLEDLLVIDCFEALEDDIDWQIIKDTDTYFPLLVDIKNPNARIVRWKYRNLPVTTTDAIDVSTREELAWDYFGRSIKMSRAEDWLDVSGGIVPECSMNVNYIKVQESEKLWLLNAKQNLDIKYLSTDWVLGLHTGLNQKKTRIPIRSKHLIKTIYFAVRNTTTGVDPSNYSNNPLKPRTPSNFRNSTGKLTEVMDNHSPIEKVSLFYWKNARFHEIDSTYFTTTQPYMHGLDTSDKVGIHMFSFNHNLHQDDLSGYANFEELGNVELEITLSDQAMKNMNLTRNDLNTNRLLPFAGIFEKQKYEFVYGYESLCLLRYKEGDVFVFK